MVKEKNLCAKTRKVDDPYEIYQGVGSLVDWEWRVLKKWQSPSNEANNPYARWFCAVKSPMTYGDWEYGDTYITDILPYSIKVFPKQPGLSTERGIA